MNVRSVSVAWSPSNAESTETSTFTTEEEDEEPEEMRPPLHTRIGDLGENLKDDVELSPSDAESTDTSTFTAEEEDKEPEENRPPLHTLIGDFGKNIKGDVELSPSDAESTDTSTFTTEEEDKEPEENRPPLHTLIADRDKNITGDVEFLLDFAIIGHAKTATTFTMQWLAKHDEIQMYGHEQHIGRPAELVSQLYTLPVGIKYKRGYKAPNDITSIRALEIFAKYWPDCKLIVGVRHPVSWFESYYNFRIKHGFVMPPADSLIGKCTKVGMGVCTEGANFHLHLNLLGKTNQTTPEEKKLLTPLPSQVPKLSPLHNPVFLYVISQLHEDDEARAFKYRRDLGNFLGLKHELSPIRYPKAIAKKYLDICEDRYRPLRRVLMDIAKPASEWIRTYFMQSPDVVVSSPEYVNELLLEWLEDPCDKESDEKDPERSRLSS
jgi:hypothetical protein